MAFVHPLISSIASSRGTRATSVTRRRALQFGGVALAARIVQRSHAAMSVKVTDTKVGDGAEVVPSKRVKVHYTLTLNGFEGEGGSVVDSSRSRGRPFTYRAGVGEVIKGWDEGVTGMKVGGKRTLVIPPELGYGAAGAGGVIPGNATLYFDIELLDVK